MLGQIQSIQKEILAKNNRMLMVFCITDMLYISIMFLVHFLPWGYVVGISSAAGGIISGIIMCYLTTSQCPDGRESLAGKLRYFPVGKKTIRMAQYGKLFQITMIQTALTLIPIIVMAFRFKLVNTISALLGTILSMCLTGTLLIEINLIEFGRKK